MDNWRWQGVPFYLRSGKLLPAKVTEITVQFKDVPHKLFPGRQKQRPHANFLSFCIQPDEGMHLRFETKMPGAGHAHALGGDGFPLRRGVRRRRRCPDAYERLLLDAMTGDASLFARADEIELSWQIIDPIQAGWEEGALPARGAEDIAGLQETGALPDPARRCYVDGRLKGSGDWRIETAPPLEFYEKGTWGPLGANRCWHSPGGTGVSAAPWRAGSTDREGEGRTPASRSGLGGQARQRRRGGPEEAQDGQARRGLVVLQLGLFAVILLAPRVFVLPVSHLAARAGGADSGGRGGAGHRWDLGARAEPQPVFPKPLEGGQMVSYGRVWLRAPPDLHRLDPRHRRVGLAGREPAGYGPGRDSVRLLRPEMTHARRRGLSRHTLGYRVSGAGEEADSLVY